MESNSRVSTKLLGAAIKAVPQVKYALGIAGVMAALALGKTFFSSTTEAVVGALAMLVLMFLLLVHKDRFHISQDSGTCCDLAVSYSLRCRRHVHRIRCFLFLALVSFRSIASYPRHLRITWSG
jgi:hypothetical protein